MLHLGEQALDLLAFVLQRVVQIERHGHPMRCGLLLKVAQVAAALRQQIGQGIAIEQFKRVVH
jgi:hypothetical protein